MSALFELLQPDRTPIPHARAFGARRLGGLCDVRSVLVLCLLTLGPAAAYAAEPAALHPDPAVAKHLRAGYDALHDGEFGDAARAFRRADRRAQGTSFDAFFGLATALRGEGKPHNALKVVRRAQPLATDDGQQIAALDLLAMNLVDVALAEPGSGRRLEQLDEAMRSLDAALALAPDQAKLHLGLAATAFHLGDLERAQAHHRRATELGVPASESWHLAKITRWLDQAITTTDGHRTTRPIFLEGVQPSYTNEARKRFIGGTVVLRASIDSAGHVTSVEIEKNLPYGLGEQASMAVETWRFAPATRDGEPVASEETLSVHFGALLEEQRQKDTLPVPRGHLID
ncbi:MAG: TonB family protein [Acidobacteriota bacterium]